MAARKNDGQKPPESGRRAVIWRLPASRSADPVGAGTDRPRKRVPLPLVWGLVAALVCVGLYAAWSVVGRDMLSTGGQQDAAAIPAAAAPVAGRAGNGPEGGGAAAPPPADGDGAPLAGAEEGPEARPSEEAAPVVRAEANAASVPSEDAAPGVAVEEGAEADPSDATDAALPESAAADPPPSSPAADTDGPQAAPAIASAGNETTATAAADEDADAGTDALGALAERLTALEAQAAGAMGAESSAVMALEQRVRVLEDDPTRVSLGRTLAAWNEQRAALEGELAQMSERLARFEAEAAQRSAADGRLVALVLATGELTSALGSSRPFAPALDSVGGIADDDPEVESALARIAPFAASGVPTLDGLRARFPEAANAIVRAASGTDDADWMDETVTRLSRLVTIRRTGGAIDPNSVDGRLVEAETALASGDLGQAIAIVETLTPGAAEAGVAEPWLRDARARHAADDALAALVATLHARIGARWAATGTPP